MKAILPKGQAYLLFLLNEWTCTEQWRKTRSFADARVKSLKLQESRCPRLMFRAQVRCTAFAFSSFG
jgi:hypothetical protein